MHGAIHLNPLPSQAEEGRLQALLDQCRRERAENASLLAASEERLRQAAAPFALEQQQALREGAQRRQRRQAEIEQRVGVARRGARTAL